FPEIVPWSRAGETTFDRPQVTARRVQLRTDLFPVERRRHARPGPPAYRVRRPGRLTERVAERIGEHPPPPFRLRHLHGDELGRVLREPAADGLRDRADLVLTRTGAKRHQNVEPPGPRRLRVRAKLQVI